MSARIGNQRTGAVYYFEHAMSRSAAEEQDRYRIERLARMRAPDQRSNRWKRWRDVIGRDIFASAVAGLVAGMTVSVFIYKLEQDREEQRFDQAQRLENLRFVRTANAQPDAARWRNFQSFDLQYAQLTAADLTGANLYEANLHGADLFRANLEEANLEEADLSETALALVNLSGANLHRVNLKKANLSGGKLYGARLWEADLEEANLSGAILLSADLSGAKLRWADLEGAQLSRARLWATDITGVKLSGADLTGVDLTGALWDPAAAPVWPEGFTPPENAWQD